MHIRMGAWLATATVLMGVAAVPSDALACSGLVGDYVWVDTNGNGLQDAGEPGLNGVTLIRTPLAINEDDGDVVTSTVTARGGPLDRDGWYEFPANCATDYRISVSSVPDGYFPTSVGIGNNPAIDSDEHSGTLVNLLEGEVTGGVPSDLTIDFGYRPVCTGSIGDRIWNDVNQNGVQDVGETGLANVSVQLGNNSSVLTDANGFYQFSGLCEGTYTVRVTVPQGFALSPTAQGTDSAIDSNGTSDGLGGSTATIVLGFNQVDNTIDFGFYALVVTSPGTGTPGYWKNHSEAWPVDSITIGGTSYSKAFILSNNLMEENPRDKRTTIFRALVAAKLNVLIGNNATCVAGTIAAADAWFQTNSGAPVRANSQAWRDGEPLYRTLDNYNNGMLCAPARD